MSIRYDATKVRPRLRAEVECPACGLGLEVAGLVRAADLVTAHLRYACRCRTS